MEYCSFHKPVYTYVIELLEYGTERLQEISCACFSEKNVELISYIDIKEKQETKKM